MSITDVTMKKTMTIEDNWIPNWLSFFTTTCKKQKVESILQ